MWIIAGGVAALLTFFDLDRTFYIPSKIEQSWKLHFWYFGFVLVNGALASGLYVLVAKEPALEKLPEWFSSFLVGTGYLAFVRLKVATIKVGDQQEVPLGVELIYEAARSSVYRRINKIAKNARIKETLEMIENKDLATLVLEANADVEHDALLSPTQKEEFKQWISNTLSDEKSTEADKKITLANYILSGQKSN